MINFGSPCFCDHCMREFAVELGLGPSFHYRNYLRGRGVTHTAELLELAKQDRLPLWHDYVRFQQQTVTRFFRRLRIAMDRDHGGEVSLSVNGSVTGFGGAVDTVLPFVTYFHGETHDFSPSALLKLAEASRAVERMQIVSLFPRVPGSGQHAPEFVASVRQAIAVCYCLGLVPLFPYDVYAGREPRWYGTWEEYREPYEYARDHADWIDDYAVVVMRHRRRSGDDPRTC